MPWDRILVSLPYSHYVEIARWSLTLKGESFYELKIPVGPHLLIVPILRILFSNGKVNNSTFPGHLAKFKTNSYRRRLSSIPYTIGKRDYHDSWSIMKSCDIEINDEIMKSYDTILGPRVRQFAYYHVFESEGLF